MDMDNSPSLETRESEQYLLTPIQFPYPISESSELRKEVGATLYLLSNFYSVGWLSVARLFWSDAVEANVQ
jgi:hypothetical protein